METAEMMYGVSMDTDGTSKVICQRLAHAADASSQPADGDPEVIPAAGVQPAEVPAAEPVH
jgi:hypothetical protein